MTQKLLDEMMKVSLKYKYRTLKWNIRTERNNCFYLKIRLNRDKLQRKKEMRGSTNKWK